MQGITGRYEIQMITKKDKTVHVELACSPMFDDRNLYSGSIAVVRDITKRIELRKQYQKFLKVQGDKSKNMLAICANCKSVRDKKNSWIQVEDFFEDIIFSHGICPACCEKLYPDFDLSELDKEDFDI